MSCWEFWIDVGGTFTDCVAQSPDGRQVQFKTLSSGVTKGRVQRVGPPNQIQDSARTDDPPGFWRGYAFTLLEGSGQALHSTRITGFDAAHGTLQLETPLPSPADAGGLSYELSSGEEAPVVAIRRILELPLNKPIPEVSVRLGTTRGTNALLTRSGARTAFVTTRGFRDILLIGNQDRPRLFETGIRKPERLFEHVVEIDERLDSDGNVLRPPDPDAIRRQFDALRAHDVESVAICLLHSFANPEHEELVERIAAEAGFSEISTSSHLSPLIRIVSRGDTTVVDAYLNPVLRDYVQRLRESLGDSRLKIMTSAGGLVNADRFVGKDSILSGPAGGVVGFSRVALQAGFEKSIGFDMGGTSTDVARFDGTWDREFETKKAGVRVVAPMLAIETVASGGGSICGFDGVKLHVGPASAGAEPGPACYGRGGPLTVTDLNLYLGRIVPSRFPFPLDPGAVKRRLDALCEQIADSPLGRRYELRELAEGFLEIANANMVRAIRRISTAKGYDPADYVLVTFGGAGAQHAGAIASELGIETVLVHPYAGILSAWGIGLADVRRFREQSVLRPWVQDALESVEPLFLQLQTAAESDVLEDGVPQDRVESPVRSLDLRYRGVESAINVVQPADGDYAREYESAHEQLYGYRHKGREIEIVAARVEVVGTMPHAPIESEAPVARVPVASERVESCFAGRIHEAAVFERNDLRPGDQLHGPCIVCESTSTVVIEPDFRAVVLERGEIRIQKQTESHSRISCESAAGQSDEPDADPVRLEIFNNLFASIAEQMGVTLQKTSVSTNVKERLDFSCAIFDTTGSLVVNAPHIPVHLGAMGETVKRIIADNSRMSPGDVFVTNDPYRGGSHLPDVTVVTPVHHDQSGELLFFTASRAHHAEIGGIVPGSMPPFSRNLGEEGILIRNFKLVDRGTSRETDLKRLLESGPFPSRSVDDNLIDVSAQVAANNSGVRQLTELVRRYSLPIVQAYMRHIQRAAAEKMRLALSAIPDGTYSLTDFLDDGTPVSASITIENQSALVDFTGTGPVLATNLNANRAIATAAALYVFRCLIDDDIPLNGGVLEPVEIILPQCLLNPPEHSEPLQCAAVVGGNVETSQRVVDVLLGALGVAAASQGTMNNLTFGDATFGYYETICGGEGATRERNGADAVHTHMTNTRLTDPEVIERRYPVRVWEFSVREGSGGNGRTRGGNGVIRRLEFLRPLKVSMLSERRDRHLPFGLDGGGPGSRGENLLRRANASRPENLGSKFAIEVAPGDVLIIQTPGGGGFGTTEA